MKKITKWAFRWHGWLGLSSGLFFLILGITGSLLLFRQDLDRALNQAIYHRPGSRPMISADSAYRIVAKAFPDLEKIVLHDFPLSSEEPYEFMLYRQTKSPYDSHLSFAFVDSHQGLILRQGNYAEFDGSFFRWIYALHYSFLLGRIGQATCAIVGVLLLLTIISGLVVYRKYILKVLLFQVPLYPKGRRLFSALHRVVGVWSALINIILVVTGIWMNIPVFQNLFSEHQAMAQQQGSFTAKTNLDKLMDYCKRAAPNFEPIAINIPKDNESPILVRGHLPSSTFFLFGGKASHFAFDPVKGSFETQLEIEKADFSKKISWAIYQLHIGGFGGYTLKLIYALIGLTPAVLALTGTYLWYKRNCKITP